MYFMVPLTLPSALTALFPIAGILFK